MSDLVLQAIDTLYAPTVDERAREEANKYLDNWQHSVEAWTYCLDILLKDSSVVIAQQTRLFLIQILRRKITNELSQLSPQLHKNLRDNILSLIQMCTQSSLSSHTIVVQLCLCLSQLSIHMNQDEWPTPIQDICYLLTGMPSSLKEFLILFPEEAHDSLESLCHKRAQQLLSDNVEHVFMYMRPDLLKCISSDDSESISKTLCCFQRWTRAMEPAHQHILEQYAPHLVSLIIAAFRQDSIESSDNASELASEIIYKAYKFNWGRIIEILLSKASSFLDLLKDAVKQPSDDEDIVNVVKSLAYIFIDLLNDSISNLLSQSSLSQDILSLLDGVLLIAQYPDFKIIEVTFKLIQTLSDAFRDQGRKYEPKSYCISALPIGLWLSTYVVRLIERMKHPSTKQEWTSQKYDDFRSFRHVIGDVLKDCSDVLGIDHVLKFIYEKIENHLMTRVDNNSWMHFEGYLSTLRMLSSCVSDQESVYISCIMNHLPTICAFQQSSEQYLAYSCILFISSYATWTQYHLDTLQRQVELIQQTLLNGNKLMFSASMLSLRNLCKYATNAMTRYGDWMLKIYHEYETIGASHDVDMLFQCIALLIAKMPDDSFCQSLSNELLKKIDYYTQSIVDNGNLCTDVLTRYAILIEVINNSSSLVPSFVQNMRLFSNIYTNVVLPKDNNVLEALGQVERHAFQYFNDELIPHLDIIALMMLEGFYKTSSPSILYTIKRFVKQYAHLGTKDNKYSLLFDKLLACINDQCMKLGDAIVEDWFGLLAIVLEYIPEIIIEQNTLSSLIQLTERYFISKNNHDPVIVSLLLIFWNDIYHVLLDDNQPSNIKDRVRFITDHITNFTYIMIKCVCNGSIPPTALSEVSQLIRTFGRIDSSQVTTCFQTYLMNHVPVDKMTATEKESYMKNIAEAIRDGKNLSKSIRQLSRISRHRGI